MTINVPIKEFYKKWTPADRGDDVMTNGILFGEIKYESNEYVVIELIKEI